MVYKNEILGIMQTTTVLVILKLILLRHQVLMQFLSRDCGYQKVFEVLPSQNEISVTPSHHDDYQQFHPCERSEIRVTA